MRTRGRNIRGMSLLEVTVALGLLSFVAVFLLGAITILTRRDVIRVNNLAAANAYASRYLETQRSLIRRSSLKAVNLNPVTNQVIPGTIYTATVALRLGTVAGGSFVAFTGATHVDATTNETHDVNDRVVLDADGNPVPSSVVLATVTLTWPEYGKTRTLARQDILAPRKS